MTTLNSLLFRLLLNGVSYGAVHWLKLNPTESKLPPFVRAALAEGGCKVSGKKADALNKYQKHVKNRPPICIDMLMVAKFLATYQVGGIPDHHAAKVENLNSILQQQHEGGSESSIMPFSTTVVICGACTGRDTTQGLALSQIPKAYWAAILSPPEGYSYVIIDYQQQEPAIIAAKSGASAIMDLYAKGDLYETLNSQVTSGLLDRKSFKTLMTVHLYGGRAATIARKIGHGVVEVIQWLGKLKVLLKPLSDWLNIQLYQSKQAGQIQSLDWQVNLKIYKKDTAIRNWPVQACGADIMRRACLALENAEIPVLLTEHDGFLIQVKAAHFDQQILLAQQALGEASAMVLGGFKLKSKVERIFQQEIGK